ncbi:hypothetical protein [Marichromatium bheemlicum]|uniref:LSDAT prokaryote domain-containing protein n=1 Tax=Marichromatium bheemlicum TaxID=365339 RepID=A0ABX1IEK5_9GAMM|nr:hypothetical protein [Marichromatium bheemlicum]NKN34587.1 hypothetical protein [Marichromatium bheemlicum]
MTRAAPGPLRLEPTGPEDLTAMLTALGFDRPRPVLTLIGGAARLDPARAAPLGALLRALAPRLDALNTRVIDGGTDCGVMAQMGRARAACHAHFPLLGVAPRATVVPHGTTDIEPNHSHLVLTPGTRWGDESPWIRRIADLLAGPRPRLTLAVGGGEITRLDLELALAEPAPLLLLAGSGGSTDALLARWRQGGLERRATIEALDLNAPATTLAARIAARLAA